MRIEPAHLLDRSAAKDFDVICAGDARWNVEASPSSALEDTLQLRPGGGALNSALALRQLGLRVGLATVLADDRLGRTLKEAIAGSGIDTDGIELAGPTSGLVFVSGGARQVLPFRDEAQALEIPTGWSAQVLLLSGMSPVVSQGGALCKAARAARRVGSAVVVDINAEWELWRGRDSRTIRMVLREADVVWCSVEDLLGLNVDMPTLRASLRPTTVLAMRDGVGRISASGPFGEVVAPRREEDTLSPIGQGSLFAAALCAELARTRTGERSGELWLRALERGQALCHAALRNSTR
jgi:sugar/nucleoside kinase (ribokinase family)